jgi:hypothetical protein
MVCPQSCQATKRIGGLQNFRDLDYFNINVPSVGK